MTALALDVGGTKLAATPVGDDGTPLAPLSVPTPPAGVWDAAVALLRRAAGDRTITAVGIASAGPVDTTAGTASPINIAEWATGFPLADAVQALFPDARVRLIVDGAAAALGEQRHGAGRGTADLLSVVLSTGIGGGLVLDGRVRTGRSGNAGHVGHMTSAFGVDQCACGATGCIETVASGPATVRWARRHGWTGTDAVALCADAAAGNRTAATALERAGTALGQILASAAALTDVGLVVVGGGFAQAGPPLWGPMQAAATRYARLSFLHELRIVPAELGSLGTLTGAGVLAIEP
ncbi:ROK family protein [Rhodococcus phenolicus]|uniref:ROK family protein n=1 Tax=Rhodococcus phenolicus TaxID=263849 RepID=UPI000831C615|nr:ROK family protein [Rhodococcus phenolicus]